MADSIIITEQDRLDAENLLEQFLVDKFTNADGTQQVDFSKGGAMRDFVVSAMAYIFAYLMRERDLIRARQSLLLLGRLTGTDVDDAVDEILSNWFITRKIGSYATGIVTVYLTQQVDVVIPTTTKFYKTSALAFAPYANDTITVAQDDLAEIVDASGAVVAYTFNVLLKAMLPGEEYNVDTGAFVDFTRFNPYIVKVENNSKFSGGGGTETTEDLLTRANTAITVRDLNSVRSIDASLREEFSEMEDLTVFGFGDPEMLRDLVLEEATHTRIHAGGYADVYVRMPLLLEQMFEAEVGGAFTDPRPEYCILRDDTVDDFVDAGVIVGDVIRVQNAMTTSESSLYIVKAVTPYGVYVSPRSQFPMALPARITAYPADASLVYAGSQNRVSSAEYVFTADDVTEERCARVLVGGTPANVGTGKIIAINASPNYAVVQGFPNNFTTETGVSWDLLSRTVEYTIGDNSSDYNNKISGPLGVARLSGRFTKSIQKDGRIVLPAHPVYRILDASLPGTGFGGLVGPDGRVHFPQRMNVEPTVQTDPDLLEYQVSSPNPYEAFSGYQVMELDVAWAGEKTKFNGKTLRVTYDTISGYDSVWAMMTSEERRIICGSVIPKGFHPVYLKMEVSFKHAKTATQTLDQTAAATALAEFLNTFNVHEDIDPSDIVAFLRQTYPEIGYIAPLTIDYDLLAPDGRVIHYQTTNEVVIDPSKQHPDYTDPEYLLADPLGLGVTSNTVRYLAVEALLTFVDLEAA